MKASELVSVWGTPDNSRLTAKQSSFRLPVHVAAKISALCDLYPSKTKTQIVSDLLSAALLDVEKALPSYQGRLWEGGEDHQGNPLFYAVGPAAQFRERTNVYFKELEQELGIEEPSPFYTADLLWQE
jgi:hypothetical protein